MVLCDREKVRYLSSLRLFVKHVNSCKKAGDDSDALKDFEPVSRDELPLPHCIHYTAPALQAGAYCRCGAFGRIQTESLPIDFLIVLEFVLGTGPSAHLSAKARVRTEP
jgi:hypothetical protein